jgi:SAM-dependent methyltransferase
MIKRIFEHPLTRRISLDDPRTTILRRRIISEKKFLRKVYQDWYRLLSASLPAGDGAVLELGSGAGFLEEFIPGLISSEIFYLQGISLVCDGQKMPFEKDSLRGILMTDVLHHIPRVRLFFREALRILKVGGVISMVEPWNTNWSKVIYSHQHHEVFNPKVAEWEFTTSGPLSGANTALPWIIFSRDQVQFKKEFPGLRIMIIKTMMPFRYLASGGVSMRSLMPGWSYALWGGVEQMLSPWMNHLGLFAHILIERID